MPITSHIIITYHISLPHIRNHHLISNIIIIDTRYKDKIARNQILLFFEIRTRVHGFSKISDFHYSLP